MTKISILLITSYYPPINHVASNRMASFAKYLDKEKYELHIILEWSSKQPVPQSSFDGFGNRIHYVKTSPLIPDLTQQANRGKLSHKGRALINKLLFFFLIDDNPDFTKKATLKAVDLVSTINPKVLITSFGPRSSVLIGVALKKRFSDLFWISDMRDEMAQAGSATFWVRKRLRGLELEMTRLADLITSVSRPMLEIIDGARLYPEKLLEVRNGYDFDPIKSCESTRDYFRILYAGSFYGSRKPDSLFKAIGRLLEVNSEFKFRIDIYGAGNSITVPERLLGIVNQFPKISYSEVVAEMTHSDALLLVQNTSDLKGIYTGKLFDYLAINRPIIALIDPSDVAADLIREVNAGYIVDSDDEDGIVELLERAYQDWAHRAVPQRNWGIVELHHRSVQFKKIQAVLDAIFLGVYSE